jgi:hypothetical protein
VRFVWTAKGKKPHVSSDTHYGTLCGRPIVGDVDASDVLYYGVCERCALAAAGVREIMV